jgi:hypothetical protein
MTVKADRVRGRHKKRRNSWHHHLQEWLWPSMGLRAMLRFMEIRIKHQQGTEHKIALGFAVGVFIGFIPTVGQVMASMILAYVLGGHILAAVVGSFVGNPWTFPFMWAWEYQLGSWLLGNPNPPPFPDVATFLSFITHFGEVWWSFHFPTIVGAMPSGILAGFFGYWLLRFNLKSYQSARRAFLTKRRQDHMMALKLKQTLPPRHRSGGQLGR